MAIDKNTVKYVAHLARIRLNEDELDLLSSQLESIIDFIDKLKELNISGVQPTSSVLAVGNVFREDKPRASLTAEESLSNAPEKKDNFFGVPKVIE